MNNNLCPFCHHPLYKQILQEFKRGKDVVYEFYYHCDYLPCQEYGPQKMSRWSFHIWEGRYVNYYRARLPKDDKFYIIRGNSNAWTRLFYDAANNGAMMQAPILEIPYVPLQEPLNSFLDSLLHKMDRLIIFT